MLTSYEARQDYRELHSWTHGLVGMEPTTLRETIVLEDVTAIAGSERVRTDIRLTLDTDRGVTQVRVEFDHVLEAYRQAAQSVWMDAAKGELCLPPGFRLVIEEEPKAQTADDALRLACAQGPEVLPSKTVRCELDPAEHMLLGVGKDGREFRLIGHGLRKHIPWPVPCAAPAA